MGSDLVRISVLILRQIVLVLILLIGAISGSNINVGMGYPLQIPNNPNPTLTEAAKNYESSIVMITGTTQTSTTDFFGLQNFGAYMTMGTGFIVSGDGTILTNKHVVGDVKAEYKVVTNNGDRYTVSNIYRDPNNDIAVVKINPIQHPNNKLAAIDLGDSNTIKVGESVATVGNDPGQLEKSIKTGVVMGVGYRVIAENPYQNSRERLNNVIETNLDLVPGNSGSPLIDDTGKVVGINTATATTFSDQSFALPIDPAKSFLNSIQP